MQRADGGVNIILATYSSDGSGERCGADYLLIELTPAYAERIMDRVHMFRSCEKQLGDLAEMYFHDPGLTLFTAPPELDDRKDCETGHEFSLQMCDSGQLFLTQEAVEIPEEYLARVEDYSRLIVDGFTVQWMVWLDESDVRVFSAEIPVEFVEKIAAREWSPGCPSSL